MRLIASALPATLFVIAAALQARSLLDAGTTAGLTLRHHLLWGVIFATIFYIPGAVCRGKASINVATVYAAHRHVPTALAGLAYALLGISLALIAHAFSTEFCAEQRVTAFWMAVLSCPCVVWWHHRAKLSRGTPQSTASEA